MRFKSEIKAIFILLWMVIRYIFVCLFWPFLQKKKNEGLKLYFNGDILTPPLKLLEAECQCQKLVEVAMREPGTIS